MILDSVLKRTSSKLKTIKLLWVLHASPTNDHAPNSRTAKNQVLLCLTLGFYKVHKNYSIDQNRHNKDSQTQRLFGANMNCATLIISTAPKCFIKLQFCGLLYNVIKIGEHILLRE